MGANLGVTKRSQLTHSAKAPISTESTTLVVSTTVELIFLRPRREVDEYDLHSHEHTHAAYNHAYANSATLRHVTEKDDFATNKQVPETSDKVFHNKSDTYLIRFIDF